MSLAPIVLFVYNRPNHTKATLQALKANILSEKSELFVFADGGKLDATIDDIEKIKEVREIVKSDSWCKSVTLIESDKNKGLANSIVAGVTEIVNKNGKVIVLEDDLVTSPYFLKYMNETLDLYESVENVACISGYVYPVYGKLPTTFFIKGTDCWGWATWKRAWAGFEADGTKLLDELELRKLGYEFNFNNSYEFVQMLKDQIEGKNNSWAIRWHASAFLKGKLCLYPAKSFVQNIGNDGSGTHSGFSDNYKVEVNQAPVKLDKITNAEENLVARKLFIDYFKKTYPKSRRSFKIYFKGLVKKSFFK